MPRKKREEPVVESANAVDAVVKEEDVQVAEAEAVPDLNAVVAQLLEENRRLARQLGDVQTEGNAARAVAASAVKAPLFAVRSTGMASISAGVTDDRGVIKSYFWEGKGKVHMLTAPQIYEIREKTPKLFDEGFLLAPDVIEAADNIIPDISEFIANTPVRDATARIRRITSASVLYAIFHHIETSRHTSVDVDGKDLKDEAGLPRQDARDMTSNEIQILQAVSERLRAVTGTVPSMTDTE